MSRRSTQSSFQSGRPSQERRRELARKTAPVEVKEGFVSDYERKVSYLFSTNPLGEMAPEVDVQPELLEAVRDTVVRRKTEIDNYLEERGQSTLSVNRPSLGHLRTVKSDYQDMRAKTNIFLEEYKDILTDEEEVRPARKETAKKSAKKSVAIKEPEQEAPTPTTSTVPSSSAAATPPSSAPKKEPLRSKSKTSTREVLPVTEVVIPRSIHLEVPRPKT